MTVPYVMQAQGPNWAMGTARNDSLLSSLSVEQKEFLARSLNNPKGVELLFIASEHEFNRTAFHQRCDNINNTPLWSALNFAGILPGSPITSGTNQPVDHMLTMQRETDFLAAAGSPIEDDPQL